MIYIIIGALLFIIVIIGLHEYLEYLNRKYEEEVRELIEE